MRSLLKGIRVLSIDRGHSSCIRSRFPQTVTGRILGTVTDSTGAAIPGAAVTITDTQTGNYPKPHDRRLRRLRGSQSSPRHVQGAGRSQGIQDG